MQSPAVQSDMSSANGRNSCATTNGIVKNESSIKPAWIESDRVIPRWPPIQSHSTVTTMINAVVSYLWQWDPCVK